MRTGGDRVGAVGCGVGSVRVNEWEVGRACCVCAYASKLFADTCEPLPYHSGLGQTKDRYHAVLAHSLAWARTHPRRFTQHTHTHTHLSAVCELALRCRTSVGSLLTFLPANGVPCTVQRRKCVFMGVRG